jgi:hypothetical protein
MKIYESESLSKKEALLRRYTEHEHELHGYNKQLRK